MSLVTDSRATVIGCHVSVSHRFPPGGGGAETDVTTYTRDLFLLAIKNKLESFLKANVIGIQCSPSSKSE